MTLLPRSDPPIGLETWACHSCGANGRGNGADHLTQCPSLRPKPRDGDTAEAMARALNEVQHALMGIQLDEMAGNDARNVKRAREAALDALIAAGREIWT